MLIKKYILFILLIFLSCSTCFANEVYFIDIDSNGSIENIYLEVASNYYGIEIVSCSSEKTCMELISIALKRKTIDAIISTASSLSILNYEKFFKILNKSEKKIPIMIFGINPDTRADVKLWSNGSIKNVVSISSQSDKSFYLFSDDNNITRQLAGLSLHNKNELAYYFYIESENNLKSIMSLYIEKDKHLLPVFINNMNFRTEVFFLPKILNDNMNPHIGKDHFYELAPFLMFLRYACKDRCWHSNNYFANLTIDDPWLREPYGNLSYVNLLDEMKKENFHTTIAFVPWNYDRSDQDVATLIRKNTKYFSIVIHGNDHNHKEFYPLNNHNDNGQSKKLHGYDKKIKQALARMEKLKELTNIPYDPIMVFPHNIAPQYAFSLLKKNGYLATINSRNVPLGSPEPTDPTQRLRCITNNFEGFPSFRRNGDEYISKEDIAIELFLENPIFIFRHQGDFADNIGRFNKIARIVNSLQPDVKWGSLGYIIRNYHLEKQKEDGNYDILMYTNELIITNHSNASLKYFIKKKELPSYSKLLKIFVDGRPISYRYNNEYITFEIMIPKNKSREIAITYRNEMTLLKTDLAKNNYYYATLRYISDFRDIVVSKNKYGRKIVDIYYNPASLKITIIGVIGLFCFIIVVFISFKKKKHYI